ncbi:2-phosphosulfolactate phosphatase [Halobacillus locisalis]|uniref:Probable 2-phosphosulfolactate phosphatase n=1 Tax=Halobacillus locisalis TaxID=220753 RepID=A0A838CWJ2_9BACI|nr:2-phosphosulfolactate phosphatase [Halobacillus locisalis]MBA2176407.1 2-phosphosulfolactate phosphatase [Halobacillus locisalis]
MGKVDVIFKKEDIDPASMKGKVAVVFDVLFATSTITAALAEGAKGVYPVLDHVHAREKAKSLKEPYILAGEDHGKLIEGFHPPLRTYLKSVIQDQQVILSTTNGTVALQRSSQADALYACSLLNNKAMADHLNEIHDGATLTLVCSGSSRHYTLEDFFGAGSLIHYLVEGGHWTLSDGAQTALLFYNGNNEPVADLLSKAKIGRLLIGAGMDPSEVAFVSQEGIWKTIPFYDRAEGKIKEWKHELS